MDLGKVSLVSIFKERHLFYKLMTFFLRMKRFEGSEFSSRTARVDRSSVGRRHLRTYNNMYISDSPKPLTDTFSL